MAAAQLSLSKMAASRAPSLSSCNSTFCREMATSCNGRQVPPPSSVQGGGFLRPCAQDGVALFFLPPTWRPPVQNGRFRPDTAQATSSVPNMASPGGRGHLKDGRARSLLSVRSVGTAPHMVPAPFPTHMAAPLSLRLAARLAAAPRHLHCGAPRPAVGRWRAEQGLAPSSSGYGPLRDLPDWSFVDGRPTPPWKGQIRRRQEDEAFARRVAMLARELDEGLRRWREQQRRTQEAEEQMTQKQLQPKGRPRES
ncbi:LOW QUALITY PROTEIN: large ribosomal subunit protein mL52 [Carettochelys insculpta]|uniref:LOW QUALITY PROTEIN: large ribosomal subunit protein mL52 n=1 Tax=Carettochelys insculpta TaxID=44489 RepID=UPI003EBD338B